VQIGHGAAWTWEYDSRLFQLLASLWDCVSLAASVPTAGEGEAWEEQADRAQINRQAERLLDQYGNSVLRLAYTYLHNMDDAEEILQETLIRFLQKAPRLESPAHEKAWLLRVAGNLSKNRIQYNAVRGAQELKETLLAQQREDLAFVWEAVSALPVKYRAVIHLFYHEGFSTREIAGILGQKESTVRSHLMRGREKLSVILKEGYDL
jgi:RNA polymerase sigma factor (sigma-70 family)